MGENLDSTMRMSVVMTERLRNDIRTLAVKNRRSDTKYVEQVLEEHVGREMKRAAYLPKPSKPEASK